MAEMLTFALVAPLGSMGSLAVGEQRGTWDRPGRSAVLGLVAGCLGLLRTEEERQCALSDGIGVAIRRLGPATPLLTDYHTAQTASSRRGFAPNTRREELAGERETVLTRRDYRADLRFTLVLWPRAALPWTLQQLAEALRRPVFTPYLGRKSCPLGLPMAPLLVTADTVAAALRARDARMLAPEQTAIGQGAGLVWADLPGPQCPSLGMATAGATIEQRRDAPGSRVRRQFDLRPEITVAWPSA